MLFYNMQFLIGIWKGIVESGSKFGLLDNLTHILVPAPMDPDYDLWGYCRIKKKKKYFHLVTFLKIFLPSPCAVCYMWFSLLWILACSSWVFCFSASPPGFFCCSCSVHRRSGGKTGVTGSELGLRLFPVNWGDRRAGLWSGFFRSDETKMCPWAPSPRQGATAAVCFAEEGC